MAEVISICLVAPVGSTKSTAHKRRVKRSQLDLKVALHASKPLNGGGKADFRARICSENCSQALIPDLTQPNDLGQLATIASTSASKTQAVFSASVFTVCNN